VYFTVLSRFGSPSHSGPCAGLHIDGWDDFGYKTLYQLSIYDEQGTRHRIGGVKIGQFGMEEGRVSIPEEFEELDERYFSLGLDESYYEGLSKLGLSIRDRVLRGLRDVALDQDLFDRALGEKVTGVSLLRSVMPATVKGQYARLARDGVRLSSYQFTYVAPKPKSLRSQPVSLSFSVTPESHPPTNIHVLIGRNGVGKTHLLHHMARALVEDDADVREVGGFEETADAAIANRMFANLVSVTFSAFDKFEPLPSRRDKSKGVQYAYVGLKRIGVSKDGKPLPPKSPDRLSAEFGRSISVCRQGARLGRWRRALEMLEADPIFRDAEVTALASEEADDEELKLRSRKLFDDKLSSGHKIVLLTITRLVETVEERTLVLLDEPEAHLHPPLLSALVRALSGLLTNRNGVAIIATHSPVVLQEVPSSCVWKIRRSGIRVVAERPDIETFGENVGILTREVFGLEVTSSGFHKMLHDAVADDPNFDRILERFGGELGGEARAIVRALLGARRQG
jgi:predicted ATPase